MVFSDAMGIYKGGLSTVTGVMTLTDNELIFEGKDKPIRFVSGSPKKIEIKLEDISEVKKGKEGSIASLGMGIPVMKIFADKEYNFTNKLKDLRGSRQHSMDLWVERVRKAIEETRSNNIEESSGKFCPNCGERIQENVNYCPSCGEEQP